jgi:bacterioferritin
MQQHIEVGRSEPMSKEDMVRGLNEDLAAELGTIIRYNYQAGRMVGPVSQGLRTWFREEIQDELGHAAYLTDVVVDLGGEPTTTPAQFPKPESLKEMLELDLQMEKSDVEHYKAHAELADELGYAELKMKLEEMAADEEGHARDLRRILNGL